MKILIVEDEAAMLKVLVDKFTSESFTVLTAEDGVKGLEVALKEHPDLILLDILMPKMDGIGMLKKLRADVWGTTAPVIILTNLNPNDTILNVVTKTHPTYYIMKADSKLEDLVGKVKEVIENKAKISNADGSEPRAKSRDEQRQ